MGAKKVAEAEPKNKNSKNAAAYDLIIAQVHMAAAAFAHGGLGSGGDFQFGSALETADPSQLDGGLGGFRDLGGSFRRIFFETEMGAAFLADGGVTAARLLLDVTALGASRRNGF